MAGGALGGVIGAALRVLPHFKEEWIQTPFYDNIPLSQMLSALGFVALCLYTYLISMKRPKSENE
jgi:hypothetical protein